MSQSYESLPPEVADESGGDGGGGSYQQSTGGDAESSVNGGAVKRTSGLSATLAEVPNIFAAFGSVERVHEH